MSWPWRRDFPLFRHNPIAQSVTQPPSLGGDCGGTAELQAARLPFLKPLEPEAMWPALILLAQLLHRETLVPVQAESTTLNAVPAKSKLPLEKCREGESQQDSCVCLKEFQICQPLQLSAWVDASIILPCDFTYHQDWEPSSDVQLHWRLGSFHSTNFLFNYSSRKQYTHPNFHGRVSWVGNDRQTDTASIQIGALRASDSLLYFCRVSVMTGDKREEWQTINGTNLTVTASPPSPGLHVGVPTGAALLAAAVTLGLVAFLVARRKGHCGKRTRSRRAASRGQGRQEAERHEGPPRGASAPRREDDDAQPPPRVLSAPGREPDLVYAALLLSDALKKAPPNKARDAEEETTYASVRH
ncbi:paired immunoglobulin-like type 2 receptor alpha isoform X2 [Eublepharis macularius]|uniref:paired immunoglobulin-like type 2 receptor alpha isoform X2 n=1 Tax=Eublepharis macularius TaxID=481883 RepID=UPI00240FE0BF|nr:paired immunoglobulin-like type 2 receptor alpha isoform X2 [Eublepharis macularius]